MKKRNEQTPGVGIKQNFIWSKSNTIVRLSHLFRFTQQFDGNSLLLSYLLQHTKVVIHSHRSYN